MHIKFARIKWIPELADQIRSADQAGFGVGFCMIVVVGYREARELDRPRYPRGVYQFVRCKAVKHDELGSADVIGCQIGIGCAARQADGIAGCVNHLPLSVIARTNSTQIAEDVPRAVTLQRKESGG
jgi:hypothetical protein